MASISGYRDGVPCWIDLSAPDIGRAQEFYAGLFGWQYLDGGPESGGYQLATLRGVQVAGIGPKQPDQPGPSAWTTYLWADDADRRAKKITEAGGTVLMGPVDVMEFGRMVIAADPNQAVFGLWQGKVHRGAGLANEPGAFTWNENLSGDPEQARTFYRRVFDFDYEPIPDSSMDYVTMKIDGNVVAGLGSAPTADLPPMWNTYFCVADTDRAAQQIVELGGRMLYQPMDTPFGRMAAAQDNGGATFSVIASNT